MVKPVDRKRNDTRRLGWARPTTIISSSPIWPDIESWPSVPLPPTQWPFWSTPSTTKQEERGTLLIAWRPCPSFSQIKTTCCTYMVSCQTSGVTFLPRRLCRGKPNFSVLDFSTSFRVVRRTRVECTGRCTMRYLGRDRENACNSHGRLSLKPD